MIKTSEWVSLGHPDKMADYISSYLLDRYIEKDPETRYAVEVQIKDNFVSLAGEVTSKCNFSNDEIALFVSQAINEIGYTREYQNQWGKENTICGDDIDVAVHISKQSMDIAVGVDNDGWGDQGIFWGMATNDVIGYMPLDYSHAKDIGTMLFNSHVGGLDIKTQVTIDVDDEKEYIQELVCAVPCMKESTIDEIKKQIDKYAHNNVLIGQTFINGTGFYVKHGPVGDCGTTGRKLAVDLYGGNCRIGGGCVDGETEYLSVNGWKKIKDYNGGEVGQIDENMHLSFAIPEQYIKTFSDDVYDVSMEKTLSMVLSGNHNVFYRTSKGNFRKKSLTDLIEESSVTAKGSHAEIPRFFEYDFPNGVRKFTAMESRLLIAHCADGTVYCKGEKSHFNCRISVKRERKIQRMRWIFNSLGIEYKEKEYKDGFTRFYYYLDNSSKLLSEHFANPDIETAKLLAEEVLLWDGSEKYGEYRTTQKADADFMQFIFSAVSGKTYSLITHNHNEPGRSTCYIVRKIRHKFSSPFRKTGDGHGHVTKLDAQNVYCFTMPTGLLLLRRKNYIFVTGNSPWTKDGTKADLTLNMYARYLAKQYAKIHPNTKEAHCSISCRIGSPEIHISFYDEHLNPLVSYSERKTPRELIRQFGLNEPIFASLCRNGLFHKI